MDIILHLPHWNQLDLISSPLLASVTPLVSTEGKRGVDDDSPISKGLDVDAEGGEYPFPGADVREVGASGDVSEVEGAEFGE